MRAYHSNPALKEKTIATMRGHREADRLIKGTYWDNVRGCAVGCMTGRDGHNEYPSRWGIPVEMAWLEDCHFEGLGNGDSQAWPERFLSAVPVGADLSMAWPRYALWLLTEGLPEKARSEERWGVKTAIEGVCALYKRWVETSVNPETEEWRKARANAAALRFNAPAASANAAYSAQAAATAGAALAAAFAAHAAVNAAACAKSRRAFWKHSADKLIEILLTCPVG